MVLLDIESPGISREIFSEDADNNDAIHQLDKLISFPAIASELVSSMTRALGLYSRGCEFESQHRHRY